ncbi:MAG TPA: class I SAM-dependent methyltransferase [Chitinophagaceae bacterium]|nr:class I SAM-dependent methyltransferase [Chitinophagaceae bacterium]
MKDNFSKDAGAYAKYRPVYPQALYDFVCHHVKEKNVAWDCGTGNGQAAKELARVFTNVWATDISQQQIDHASQAENIIYSVQPAEKTNFPANATDLITVSQALHWFHFDEFYKEVKRVGKNGSWIATWMYSLLTISPAIDQLINQQFYTALLGPYWDPERKHVDNHYTSIPFPFREIPTPVFNMEYEWTASELAGYLRTWSAVKKFIAENGSDPVDELMHKISIHWMTEKMKVLFPLHLRMGQIV